VKDHIMLNVGTPDRIIGIILGLALIVLPFVMGWAQVAMIVSIAIGLVLIITAMVRFCPLYRLLNLSTFRKQS
jgi:hypothetical protein